MALQDFALIILAAGSSSRMGTSKQLLQVDHQPLLVKTANAAIASGIQEIIVVLGANEPEHRKVIGNLPVDVAVNKGWAAGMGSSIKAGINFLLAKNKNYQGVVILVCDQPLVNASHIVKLINEYQRSNNSIVASRYAKTFGVPVLFGKALFAALLALEDSEGAKKIILKNKETMTSVDFPQGEIDLDSPEDFYKFIQNHNA